MSNVRRSTRIRDKSSRTDDDGDNTDSMDLVHMDEDIGYGNSSVDDLDDSAAEGTDDEEYQEPKSNQRKRGIVDKIDKSGTQSRSKKARVSNVDHSKTSKKSRKAFLERQQGFEFTELFQIMANSEDFSIEELANRWLESYSESRDKALQEFINFLLNCCGSLVQVREHDVVSNETANETVAEIQLQFQDQELHESYLLMSKNYKRRARYKPLYENFMEFTHKLLDLAHERGLLYESPSEPDKTQSVDQPLILDLLTWLSSLSVSKIRCLRHVATLCMYSFQDFLTALSVDLENNYLVKLRRQLGMEHKKKRANPKTAEKLEATIHEIQETKSVVENSIDNIIKLSFVHRFKDVDQAIRVDSITHLAIWLENYPEYFMKVTFLKYFGWLLSDLSSTVRLQVARVILEIVKFDNKRRKHKVGSTALRQFFDRFKQRILEISLKDVDTQVRVAAIQVLTQINAIGYMEDNEVAKISSLIFDDRKVDTSSVAKNAKLLGSVARFFADVQNDKLELLIESHSFPNKSNVLRPRDIIEAGFFMRTLVKSFSSYLSELQEDCAVENRSRLLYQAAEFLEPFFGRLIASLCELLIFDGSFEGFSDVEDTETGEKVLLLPRDENSITQYVIVLAGLCHGGGNKKNSKKPETVMASMVHLPELFATLPLHSSVVMHHLFSIYTLFTFEDWIAAHLEKEFQKVTDVIVKTFDRMQLMNEKNDINRSSFAAVMQFHKNLGLPQVTDGWKNQVGQIRVSLQVFLETKADSFAESEVNSLFTTVHETYINKLVMLGKILPLNITPDLMRLYFEKVVNKVPGSLDLLRSETIKAIDFKFVTLAITWNLQRWFEILQNSTDATPLSTNVLQTVINVLRQLTFSLAELSQCSLDELRNCLNIKFKLCDALADCLTAYKMFELNIPSKDYEWQRAIADDYSAVVDPQLAKFFLDVFLYLESLRAKELGVQLDRFEDEDVNLNDISDDNVEDVEQELIVYAVKLKGLLNLGLLDAAIIERRMSLNKNVLGPNFASIADDTAFDTTQITKRQLASANHERQIFDDRDEDRVAGLKDPQNLASAIEDVAEQVGTREASSEFL
ncbi:LAME_0H18294g1_1 [Lachancea meyersii CBS 8951]|uniref:LAME_0H18294g1_1 n=1 Tax=Lachancea meyersii CBS 8951 TaxID=1266667 RepID=A0A1G4KIN8_9SACH|nr:LAME_0H18294g1_1 [Lachancea meyersii CBS 8951]